MFKGVAPVFAVILLIAVTVGIVATTYHGISSLTRETQTGVASSIEHQFDVRGAKLKVDVFGNCKIYLRNTGTKDVPIEIISFYADDKPITPNPSTGIIKKNDVQEITFLNLNPKKYKLLVKIYGNTMDSGYLTCSGPCGAVYFACHVNTSCAVNETEIIDLSAQNNAYAETIGVGGGYSQKLCCSDISSVTTTTGKGTCGAGFTGFVTLSSDTNAQVEKYNYNGTDGFNYKKNICVNLISGSLDCKYDTKTNCLSSGYDKYVVSISSDTNAYIGDEDAYSIVRCCKKIS